MRSYYWWNAIIAHSVNWDPNFCVDVSLRVFSIEFWKRARLLSHVCFSMVFLAPTYDLMVDSRILQTCRGCFLGDDKNRTQKEIIREDREGTKWENSLCRRNGNCLTLFMESGATHYVPLPFLVIHTHLNVRKVLVTLTHSPYHNPSCFHQHTFTPIHTGSDHHFLSCLSMQVRQVTPLSVGLLIERDTTGEESSSVGLPTFFSLLHPMSDICPVSIKRPSVSKSSDLDLIAQ